MTPLSATRLAAARKGQFVPTPLEAVDLIASSIFLEPAPPKILDPSCGEGIALARLGAAWGGETWGNELERNRYDQAKEILHHCTLGPQETLDVVGEFDAIFMNPPYDLAGPGQRLEVEHVRQARGWLRAGVS